MWGLSPRNALRREAGGVCNSDNNRMFLIRIIIKNMVCTFFYATAPHSRGCFRLNWCLTFCIQLYTMVLHQIQKGSQMAKYYQKRSFNHEREASAIIASLREHGEAVGPGVCIDTVRHHWHVRYGGEVEPVCTGGGPAERYTLGRPSWL